jgi:hypothetical protein
MIAQSVEMEMLSIASQSVEEYSDTSAQSLDAMKDHEVVKECWKCEDWLDRGLKAYQAISGADNLLRSGAEQGKFDLTHELQDLIVATYETWLQPSTHAEKWIDSLSERQQRPKNADDMLIAINAIRSLVSTRRARREKIKRMSGLKARMNAKGQYRCLPVSFSKEASYLPTMCQTNTAQI